jgi:hypothetical protein
MAPVSRKRQKPKKKPSRLHRTPKSGDAYQQAVASVAKSLMPSAEIEIGVWTDGPDGRRDLDVLVRPKIAGIASSIVIECKDWNRPIGIGFIDALESKRRDIGASVAMICSNSGFTADALRKAARVGIPALSALIDGDDRIRVTVRERIYTRMVRFHRDDTFKFYGLSDEEKTALTALGDVNGSEFSYNGRPVKVWIATRLSKIAALATHSRSILARFKFKERIPIDVRGLRISINAVDVAATFTVQWRTQVVAIGASRGMYDYLQKVLLMPRGPAQVHMKVDMNDWGQPVDIEDVPPRLLTPLDERPEATVPYHEMTLGTIENLIDTRDSPDIDPFIESQGVRDIEPKR